jgi:UDP-N-acetylglucosamine 2-epimerase (non-hydrolysing)
MTRRLLYVVGARPNFVKLAPVVHALAERPGIEGRVLHTGQHYDHALAGAFLEQLSFPQPDYSLGVGSGTHAEQTGAVMVGLERVLGEERFDALIVGGDVNSTLAAALVAVKAGVPVVHVESGLRSRDWTMPEEVNRIVTDRISDLLLCHCQEAVDNLIAEGRGQESIALVGNTMIDSLHQLLDRDRAARTLARHELTDRGYVLVTLHRPALVDDVTRLDAVLSVLREVAETLPVVFPVHPRTAARLGDLPDAPGLRLIEPLEYVDFLDLESRARFVVTDSGGVQEETSALGVPCLTYRDNTERAITIELGTNRLVGVDPKALRIACRDLLQSGWRPRSEMIPLWDGHAGTRAAEAVMTALSRRGSAEAAAIQAGATGA